MSERVLLIERDARFRAEVADELARRGHRVVCAGSRSEGMAALARERFVAVVLGGAAAGTHAERSARGFCRSAGQARVVFATDDRLGDDALARMTEEVGVALVVYKPIAAGTLAEQVEAVLATPAPLSSPGIASELAALREGFAAALPERLEALAEALADARAAPADPDRRRVVAHLAHRLRGIAGPYGFPQVGELAGRIEDALPLGAESEPDALASCAQWLAEAQTLARAVEAGASRSGARVRTPTPPPTVAARPASGAQAGAERGARGARVTRSRTRRR